MIHPFAGNLKDKTLDELMDSITKLTKQQQYMFRIGKSDVVNQINLLLTTYRTEYQKRQQELWDKKSPDLNKKIDIS